MDSENQKLLERQTQLGFSLSCPSRDENFKFYWDLYIWDLSARSNFKKSHLQQLRIICDLHVDIDNLQGFVRENGASFTAFSRNGEESQRPRPEITLLLRCRTLLKDYLKLTGLILEKDTLSMEVKQESYFI